MKETHDIALLTVTIWDPIRDAEIHRLRTVPDLPDTIKSSAAS